MFKQGESPNLSWVRTKYILSQAPLTSDGAENSQDTGKELITRLQSQRSSQHLSHLQEKCHLSSISARNQKGCLPHSTKAPHLSPHSLQPRNHYFSWCPWRKVRQQGAPPSYWNSNSTQGCRAPTPRISCQGYKCSGEEGDAGKLAQVCSVNCKVTVDIIRGVSCSLRSGRRRPNLGAVITEAEEKRSSNKEPNYFYQLVKYIPTC